MGLRVAFGFPADGRGEHQLKELVRSVDAPTGMFLVRTRTRAHALERRLIEASGVTAGGLVSTLHAFVRTLAGRRRSPRRALTDDERLILIADLLRTEGRPPLVGLPRAAEWLANSFSVLKRADVFTSGFARARFPSLDGDDPLASEALRLFDLYGERLKAGAVFDEDGLWFEVARDLGTDELPICELRCATERLVVEGFYQSDPLERAVFSALFRVFRDVVWLIDAPTPDVAHPPFRVFSDHEVSTGRILGDLAWLRSVGAETGDSDQAVSTTSPVGARPGCVVMCRTAPDEVSEMRALLALAQERLAQDPEAEVLIAYPSDRAASPLFEQIAGEAGVVLDSATGRAVADTPHGRALLHVLGLGSHDFARAAVVDAFHLAGRDGPALVLNVRVSGRALDRVARAARVFEGRDSWRRALATAETLGDGAASEQIRGCAAAMGALFDLVPENDFELDHGAFVTLVRTVVSAFGILDRGVPRVVDLDVPIGRALRLDSAATRALVELLQRFSEARPAGLRATFADHLTVLTAAMRVAMAPAAGDAGARLRLVGIRELRGITADHVLVGGLTQQGLSTPPESVPLLDVRDALAAGARTRELVEREADHLLFLAARSGRRTVTLSRPLHEGSAEAIPARALLAFIDAWGESPLECPRPSGGTDAGQRLRRRRESVRRSSDAIGACEGRLGPRAAAALVSAADSRTQPVSASSLARYVACPMEYFFGVKLGLKEDEEPDRDLDPIERGTLVHEILCNFLRDRPAGEDASMASVRMAAVAERELGRLHRTDLFFEVQRERLVSGLSGTGARGLLKAWLDHEALRPQAFRPMAFELAFGRAEGAPPVEIPVNLGDGVTRALRVRGSIDRVDVRQSLERDDPPSVLIIDYKTGQIAGLRRDTLNGRQFQLPLYARAAQSLLAGRFDSRPPIAAGGAYYAVGDAERVRLGELLVSDSTKPDVVPEGSRIHGLSDGAWTRLLEAVPIRALAVVDAIAKGSFHPTAEEEPDACEHCDFAQVCRGRGEAERLHAMPRNAGIFPQSVDLLGETGAPE